MTEQATLALETPSGGSLAPVAPVAPKRFVLPEEPAVVSTPDKNTVEVATTTEPEVKPEKEVTAEQTAKREERRAQNKLEKAYRVRAEALAKAEFLEKQLAEERAKNAPKAPEGEPKLEQFDYDPEKYAAAKADYAKSQAGKEFEAKQRTETEKQAIQRLVSDWEVKAERGADKYDDWNDIVGDLQDRKSTRLNS